MRYSKLCNNPKDRSCVSEDFIWWQNAFTIEEVDSIVNMCSQEQLSTGTTVGNTTEEEFERHRKSKVRFFERDNCTSWIFERFNNVIEQVNNNYFGYDLYGYNSFQYTVYESENHGMYDWHMDTIMGNGVYSLGSGLTRKLTAVMLLSEPGVDFTGGEFQINRSQEKDAFTPELHKGMIIFFPSFILHRVKPVILGNRKSLVIWVEGPKFI